MEKKRKKLFFFCFVSGRPEYEGRSLSYDRTGDYHVKKHETYNSRGEDRERDHRVRDRSLDRDRDRERMRDRERDSRSSRNRGGRERERDRGRDRDRDGERRSRGRDRIRGGGGGDMERERTSRDVNREREMRNNRSRMRTDPDNFRNTSRESYRERTRDSEEDRYREKSRSRQRMSNSNAHSNKFTPTETSVQDSSRRYSDPTASYFNSGPRYEVSYTINRRGGDGGGGGNGGSGDTESNYLTSHLQVEPRGENFSNYFNSNNRRNNGGNHSARGRGNLVRPIMNRPFLHHTEFGTMRPVPPGAFRGPAPMGPRLAVPGRRVLPRKSYQTTFPMKHY